MMSQVFPWIERKFTFGFPVELHPNVRARLRGTPARIEELVNDLDAAHLRHNPEGKWSIQENAGHLWDLELLWLKRLDEFLAGVDTLTAADITNAATHAAKHNNRAIADILNGFRSRREQLVSSLEDLPVREFHRTALHPRLQMPIRLIDHLTFVAEHDDHHLARIWELRTAAWGAGRNSSR